MRRFHSITNRWGPRPGPLRSGIGGKADVAADDLEGDAMRLLGWVTAANLTKRLSGEKRPQSWFSQQAASRSKRCARSRLHRTRRLRRIHGLAAR